MFQNGCYKANKQGIFFVWKYESNSAYFANIKPEMVIINLLRLKLLLIYWRVWLFLHIQLRFVKGSIICTL